MHNFEGNTMFKKLGDFSVKRNFVDAFLFYLVYGAAGVFLCGVITSMIVEVSSLSSVDDVKLLAMRVAPIVAGIYTFIVAFSVILIKHLNKDALAILFAIVGAFASSSLGLVFGFVPVAVLSAFERQSVATS